MIQEVSAQLSKRAIAPLVPPLRANAPPTCKPYQTSDNPLTCRPCLIFSKDTFPWGTTSLLFQNLLPMGLLVLQMGWCRSHSKPVPVTVTPRYHFHSQSVKEGDPSEILHASRKLPAAWCLIATLLLTTIYAFFSVKCDFFRIVIRKHCVC